MERSAFSRSRSSTTSTRPVKESRRAAQEQQEEKFVPGDGARTKKSLRTGGEQGKHQLYAETDANLVKRLQCPRNKHHNVMRVLWRSSRSLTILTIGSTNETVNSCFIV